jgi:dienelactone hydrolase
MFKHEDFRFGFEIVLGSVYRGYADAGEVLATAERIKDGNGDAWVQEWSATADRLEEQARTAEGAGNRVSARGLYLRAANYRSTGLYLITHSSKPERQLELWKRHRACWDKVVDLLAVPGERLQIPYEGTTLPGYFFRAPDAEPGERRPLVVLNNGSDGPTSHMGPFGGWAALERGYHAMTFDGGPGQQAALFLQGIPFRHDWEKVLTPVVDAMVAQPDVDPGRLALIGVSQAGYWVPRALAFEHRFAAAVADPGTERLSKSTRATLHFRGEPYGVLGDSRFDLYREVLKYRLGDEVKDITTPLLITEPEDEQLWPGQSQALYDLLPGPKDLVKFTAAEGANRHCEPMGLAIRDARLFDWLSRYLDA